MNLLLKDFPDALIKKLKSKALDRDMTVKRFIILLLEEALKPWRVKP